MKKVYLLLAIIGLVVPYYFLVSFLVASGFEIPLLIDPLFANDISTLFAVDLIITAVVLLIFFYTEGHRHGMRNLYAYILATLLIGPSFALSLFLFFREEPVNGTKAN